MNLKRTIYILSATAIVLLIALLSFENTEFERQSKALTTVYQTLPVPIPAQLDFAGEDVLMEKHGIKERLDRELLVNAYWQANTILVLKRSRRVFQVIEPILKSHGIPNDFKYLAVTESALKNVTSSAGAKGVWQFMPTSAQEFGLEVNDEIDERLHLEKSTIAACKYLKQAYKKFGSWTLAAAAYNRGMGGLERALKDQSVSSFYDLHLNPETSRYIPRILAFKSILSKPSLYGFKLTDKDYYPAYKTKDVSVKSSISDLRQYAQQLSCTYHQLRTLNPWLTANTLTVKDRKVYKLKTPAK